MVLEGLKPPLLIGVANARLKLEKEIPTLKLSSSRFNICQGHKSLPWPTNAYFKTGIFNVRDLPVNMLTNYKQANIHLPLPKASP
jgi:hypothetical protein